MQTRICIIIFIGLAAATFAQEVQITFAEGGEFALNSNGERLVYRTDRINTIGLSMHVEDILQTGYDSFVELRLEPGGTRIKIAENTSLVCNGPGTESGSVSFTLLYGRMRLSSAGSSPGDGNPVYIKTGYAQAVFLRGDAGVDFLVNAAETHLTRGEPVLKVYCFNGSSKIIPSAQPAPSPAGTAADFDVREYESLSIEVLNPLSYIERKPIEDDIIRYWNRHNFSSGIQLITSPPSVVSELPPPEANSVQSTQEVYPAQNQQAPRVIERIQFVHTDNTVNKKINTAKNVFMVCGIVCTLGGIGMQTAGIFRYNNIDERQKTALINFGYIPLSFGILLDIAALVINPLFSNSDDTD